MAYVTHVYRNAVNGSVPQLKEALSRRTARESFRSSYTHTRPPVALPVQFAVPLNAFTLTG